MVWNKRLIKSIRRCVQAVVATIAESKFLFVNLLRGTLMYGFRAISHSIPSIRFLWEQESSSELKK